jgi:hypothetical protein
MAQGLKKIQKNVNKSTNKNSAKAVKQKLNEKKVRVGNPTQLPKRKTDSVVEEYELSKAIDKSNEIKVAAKLIQDGGRVSLLDIMKGGKEINRENRRKIVKKKETRVEEKLRELTEKAEKDGMLE